VWTCYVKRIGDIVVTNTPYALILQITLSGYPSQSYTFDFKLPQKKNVYEMLVRNQQSQVGQNETQMHNETPSVKGICSVFVSVFFVLSGY
jgi:hypothetical protein